MTTQQPGPITPDVARQFATRAIIARARALSSINAALRMAVPSMECEARRTPNCGALQLDGGPQTTTLPCCRACGWTFAPPAGAYLAEDEEA